MPMPLKSAQRFGLDAQEYGVGKMGNSWKKYLEKFLVLIQILVELSYCCFSIKIHLNLMSQPICPAISRWHIKGAEKFVWCAVAHFNLFVWAAVIFYTQYALLLLAPLLLAGLILVYLFLPTHLPTYQHILQMRRQRRQQPQWKTKPRDKKVCRAACCFCGIKIHNNPAYTQTDTDTGTDTDTDTDTVEKLWNSLWITQTASETLSIPGCRDYVPFTILPFYHFGHSLNDIQIFQQFGGLRPFTI